MGARQLTASLATLLLLTAAQPASAAPDEIQVYTEEMDDPGEFGLELHLNYVPKGRREASYPGEIASEHRVQVTPEFSYGLTKNLEAGLYLPFSYSAKDGELHGNGMRFRLKFIAPRDSDHGFYWGLNGEYGWSAHRVSESHLGLELRPIIGYHDDDWQISFNPILDTDLSTNASRQPKFEPALKVTHTVFEGLNAGLEYYGEYGPVRHMLPTSERTHYLYGVVDVDMHGFDMNFGIGRGIKNAEDQWVVKAIIAFPFN